MDRNYKHCLNMSRCSTHKSVFINDVTSYALAVEFWICFESSFFLFICSLISGTVKMQGEEVAKMEDFKYLGSTVQSNGECGREVKKRVQAG